MTRKPDAVDGFMQSALPRRACPHSKHYHRGTWKYLLRGGVRKPTASFTCPKCETTMALDDHRIDRKGRVWPLVMCPNPKCAWSDHLRLEGWGGTFDSRA